MSANRLKMTVDRLIDILHGFPGDYEIDMHVGYTGKSCQIQHLLECPKTRTIEIYTDQDEP